MSVTIGGTCKDCAHMDVIEAPVAVYECVRALTAGKPEDDRSNRCEAFSDDGDEGFLLVGPDFGCIHWTAKAVNPTRIASQEKA